MLIEFTVENFLSFKDSNTLNMVAGAIREYPSHTFSHRPARASRSKPVTLLKSAAIYGANAGGKSNLIKAMSFMRSMVMHSSKESQAEEPFPHNPFLLNPRTSEEPTTMEAVFVQDGIRYRYGFSADRERVRLEWLFAAPRGREARLFIRREDEFEFGKGMTRVSGLEEKTRENALFISVAAQFNQPEARKILQWFSSLQVVTDDTRNIFRRSMAILEESLQRKRLVEFIRLADHSISEMELDEADYPLSDLPEALSLAISRDMEKTGKKKDTIRLKKPVAHHHSYNDEGAKVGLEKFELAMESKGTKRIFDLAGLIFFALDNGSALIIDELECSLHPKLTRLIINLFHSEQTNPRNAQLIFATHDQTLFSHKFFRRDQLWMVSKNDVGSSELYSLSDFRVRPDSSYDKDYMQGRYGAVPVLSEPVTTFGARESDEQDGRTEEPT
ncbi:ATP-binding protein [Desulfonatronospira sp.]|uniref:AAA family ATPase n=1 Tax=Desulfonatronospira sp. TaxID=1962951 RepID=UPI0025C1C7C0|nr:ATP-binding protein [Desulfonatronospira sp.]